jgi:hypothetical protein
MAEASLRKYQMTIVCNDTTCFDIAETSYHMLHVLGLHIVIGRGMLLPVGSEREAEAIITELERGS